MNVYARILLVSNRDEDETVIPLQTAVADDTLVDAWIHRICEVLDTANEAGQGYDLIAKTYRDE